MKQIKICAYTIALNEEKHVMRWLEGTKDADVRVVVDTGSTDRTVNTGGGGGGINGTTGGAGGGYNK